MGLMLKSYQLIALIYAFINMITKVLYIFHYFNISADKSDKLFLCRSSLALLYGNMYFNNTW